MHREALQRQIPSQVPAANVMHTLSSERFQNKAPGSVLMTAADDEPLNRTL